MAFTEEQEQAILNFITKTSAPAEKPAEAPAQKAEASKTVVDEAKEAVNAEKNAETALAKIQESVKFNLSVKDFVEKNKSTLPEEASKILATVEGKVYKNESEKANAVRKNLIESFIEKQENMDFLSDSLKAKALTFKNLAETDKERRSNEFWDLVDIGVELKFNKNKAKELNIAKGIPAGGSSGNILQDKILAKAKEKFNHK
jgi:hypothetical protein